MSDTEQDQQRPQAGIESLRAIWAAGDRPQPVLPWYRQVTGKQIGVLAAGAAVLVLAVVALRSVDAGVVQRTAALPAEFAGLGRVAEDQNLAALRAEYQAQNTRRFAPRTVEVVGYGQPGATGLAGADLLAVAFNGAVPDAARAATELLGGYHPERLAEGSSVTDLRTFDPGPLGGAVACATFETAGADLSACSWADGSTLGVLVDFTGALSAEDLAARTRELRDRAERPA